MSGVVVGWLVHYALTCLFGVMVTDRASSVTFEYSPNSEYILYWAGVAGSQEVPRVA